MRKKQLPAVHYKLLVAKLIRKTPKAVLLDVECNTPEYKVSGAFRKEVWFPKSTVREVTVNDIDRWELAEWFLIKKENEMKIRFETESVDDEIDSIARDVDELLGARMVDTF